MKLLVLFLHYNSTKYPRAYDCLREYIASIDGIEWTVFRIDNKVPFSGVTLSEDGSYTMGGDNSCWEFSGWALGLEQAKALYPHADGALIVNDAFEVNKTSFLRDINASYIRTMLKLNIPIGRMAKLHHPGYIYDQSVSRWFRSNCIIIPMSCLNSLQFTSVDQDGINQFIDEQFQGNYFKPSAPISLSIQKHILEWLSVKWHSAFCLDTNWDLYRNKTRAILNEFLLSQQIFKHSFIAFDHKSIPHFAMWHLFRALVKKAFGKE